MTLSTYNALPEEERETAKRKLIRGAKRLGKMSTLYKLENFIYTKRMNSHLSVLSILYNNYPAIFHTENDELKRRLEFIDKSLLYLQ